MNASINSAQPSEANGANNRLPTDRCLSEVEYLSREVAAAEAALVRSLVGLKEGSTARLDPRRWIKEHPWLALGLATVSGFTIASAITGADRKSEGTDRQSHDGPAPDRGHPPAVGTRPLRSRLTMFVAETLLDLAKFTIQSLMIAVMQPDAGQEDPIVGSSNHLTAPLDQC
jgi:hypothetical protein